jgi:hypothetical protein
LSAPRPSARRDAPSRICWARPSPSPCASLRALRGKGGAAGRAVSLSLGSAMLESFVPSLGQRPGESLAGWRLQPGLSFVITNHEEQQAHSGR